MKTALTLAAGLAAGLALTSAASAQDAAPPPAGAPAPTDYPNLPPPRYPSPPAAAYAAPAPVYPATVAPNSGGDWTLKRREDWLRHKIDQAHDEHAIDGRAADRAHHALDRLHDDEDRMRDHQDGQLTDNQTRSLEARLDGLADEVLQAHDTAWRRPW